MHRKITWFFIHWPILKTTLCIMYLHSFSLIIRTLLIELTSSLTYTLIAIYRGRLPVSFVNVKCSICHCPRLVRHHQLHQSLSCRQHCYCTPSCFKLILSIIFLRNNMTNMLVFRDCFISPLPMSIVIFNIS